MRMLKKGIAVLLSMGLALTVLSACGNQESVSGGDSASAQAAGQTSSPEGAEETSGDPSQTGTSSDTTEADEDWDEEPAEVNWYMWSLGSYTQDGLQKVNDAINEITLKKINVKVNLTLMEMGSYLSQMPMQISAGDKIDLLTTFPAGSGTFVNMASSKQLQPLDDYLEEYCQEMMALFPEGFLDATTVDGQVTAVPVYMDATNDAYWICRKALLDEVGMTGEDIKDYNDITKAFAAVKEKHPDMKMISGGAKNLLGGSGNLFTGVRYDYLGVNVAAVMFEHEGQETKVVNLYETEEAKEAINVLREWNAAGYIDKDIMIREDDPTDDQTVFSWFLTGGLSRIINGERLAGEPLVYVKLMDGAVNSGSATILTMGIPVTATEPEGAAKLMNLLYTDAELKNLVNYGIEGVNYTLAENGGVVVDTSSNYATNCSGLFGNTFLNAPTDIEIESGVADIHPDQNTLKRSPVIGFFVNTDPISTEAAQISSIYAEYAPLVETGMADEATYQEMLDKLKASGVDKYIAEIQRQLDEWLASKAE